MSARTESRPAQKGEQFRLGIDLGGTKTEVILLDAEGHELLRRRVATRSSDYASILRGIRELVELAEASAGQRLRVGVGTPGALSPSSGLLRNSNTACLNGKPLQQDLASLLERPVRIANDANCFALSEAIDGAGADAELVFGVIIGTGTGGGVVWNRQVRNGPHGIAGEWGHTALPWAQPFDCARPCYCGKQGCIETYLSGPGMAANAAVLEGMKLDSRQIVERARAGDADCQRQLEHYFDQMARALAQVINILDPDAIVLGGGMSNIDEIYREVPKMLPRYVFSDFVATPLRPPDHGDSSGVRGAAWLWD